MNRTTAYNIEYTEELALALTNREVGLPCTQTGINTIWTDELTKTLVSALKPRFIEGYGKDYVLWLDTGSEEVAIKNNDIYNYNLASLKVNRTGKYDDNESTGI